MKRFLERFPLVKRFVVPSIVFSIATAITIVAYTHTASVADGFGATGNAGTTIAAGQPNVPYVQGIGIGGSQPVGEVGSGGATYSASYPDAQPTLSPQTSAGVVTLAAGTAGKSIYVHQISVQCTVTCTGVTVNWGWGASSCASPTYFFPTAITGPTTTAASVMLWGGTTVNSFNLTSTGASPAAAPYVLPAGYWLCGNFAVLTSGTAEFYGAISVH